MLIQYIIHLFSHNDAIWDYIDRVHQESAAHGGSSEMKERKGKEGNSSSPIQWWLGVEAPHWDRRVK